MDRALSSYAFNVYGDDAQLYNGIHDLETECERLQGVIQAVDDFLNSRACWGYPICHHATCIVDDPSPAVPGGEDSQ